MAINDADQKLGASLAEGVLAAVGWKERLLNWIFAQGSVTVVISAWLCYTIYDNERKEVKSTAAAIKREDWEDKLINKINTQSKEISNEFQNSIKSLIESADRQREHDERRYERLRESRGN